MSSPQTLVMMYELLACRFSAVVLWNTPIFNGNNELFGYDGFPRNIKQESFVTDLSQSTSQLGGYSQINTDYNELYSQESEESSSVPPLVTLCISFVVTNIGQLSSLSGFPPKVAQELFDCILHRERATKQRLLTLPILNMFLNSGLLSQLDLTGRRDVPDDVIKTIPRCSPHLDSLILKGACTLSGQTVLSIAEGCPSIKKLDVGECNRIDNQTLSSLSKSPLASTLEQLGLSSCFELTRDGLTEMSTSFGNLQRLDISYLHHIDDASVDALVAGCRSLTSIDLSHCTQLKRPTFASIAQHMARNLKVLLLRGCLQLEDVDLSHIGQKCPLLQEISIEACKLITDASIQSLSDGCRGLTSIDVSGITNLSDTSTMYIANFCKGLSHLTLKRCIHITNESIAVLVKLTRNTLQYLDIDGCVELTDECISELTECKRLEHLDVSFCRNLSVKGVSQLLSLPSLKSIHTWGHAVTASQMQQWRSRHPRLKIHAAS
ncbi:F-box/LRR-repeat protein 20-like isoform 1 [Planoprotostelium fungivorum]|uniref:F-box/LRR-repeat protein 20-like isoform 1 n=1 Tax=Planoprotostelium fungivorum TaxID=1890364 RepID=A0A2P6N113_9EUKA|nr:F-box/LRR-repeat protein 20-like isoform 1 [Planoprotostelium fungivorum]